MERIGQVPIGRWAREQKRLGTTVIGRYKALVQVK